MTCDPAARDWRITAVVAEPEAKAKAYRACSRAATASSKWSLFAHRVGKLSTPDMHKNNELKVESETGSFCGPVWVCASCIFVLSDGLADPDLSESCRKRDLEGRS